MWSHKKKAKKASKRAKKASKRPKKPKKGKKNQKCSIMTHDHRRLALKYSTVLWGLLTKVDLQKEHEKCLQILNLLSS